MVYLDSIRARLREKGIWARFVEKISLRRRLLRASIRLFQADVIRKMGQPNPAFPPLNPRPTGVCKICGGSVHDVGAVDFNKSCEAGMGIKLHDWGIPVPYVACQSCRFLFTEAFDRWSHDEFRDFIYNDGYKIVDPDYAFIRPNEIANRLNTILGKATSSRILDYGGGNGLLAKILQGKGFQSISVYDPFTPQHATLPDMQFDLITCFETFEHVPTPLDTVNRLLSFLKVDGAIIFSTLLRGREFDRQGLAWWYVAPRNGHISIYSTDALKVAFGGLPMSTSKADRATHIVWRGTPAFFSEELCRYFNIGRRNGTFVPLSDDLAGRPKLSWRDLLPSRSADDPAAKSLSGKLPGGV